MNANMKIYLDLKIDLTGGEYLKEKIYDHQWFTLIFKRICVFMLLFSLNGCGTSEAIADGLSLLPNEETNGKTEMNTADRMDSTEITDSMEISNATGENQSINTKPVITVTFRDDGRGTESNLWKWLEAGYDSFELRDSFVLNIAPITACEGDYFDMVARMLQSEKSAPNLVAEDTFQLAADVEAGYLTPLDAYLENYKDWTNGSYFESLKEGVTDAQNHVYGIPYNTDTRGLWYNKKIFKQVGLPEIWEPVTWNDILSACQTIKNANPDVIPFWCNSGVATGEATSMQTYEMLLYGTGEELKDESTGKWIISSKGILDTLSFLDAIYENNFGPPLSIVFSGQASNISSREYLPQGKVVISLDGSWITGNYLESGASPWPEYSETLGFAAMPTQYGDHTGNITMAGGWAWSIPAKSDNKELTMAFIKHLMTPEIYVDALVAMGSIGTRTDIADNPRYVNMPFIKTATAYLKVASFRPKDSDYSAVSSHIQTMVESVASGTSPEDAMAIYGIDVARTVGEDNVIRR